MAAVLLLRGKISLLPLERIANTSDREPSIYGATTGNDSIEKIARIARLMDVRESLSPGLLYI